ncbi:MAG: hypothetical protein AVO33_02825 [delta proteobacterium ML8_F1]|nr:MAG: hypothetical protein AVO33_02825 [delta proteobacterium ML8_F1]
MKIINPRVIAVKTLTAITHKKRFMKEVLEENLNGVPREQRAYVNRTVRGVVENLSYLDGILEKLSRIKLKKLREADRNILRLGLYEILFMDHIPDYATVNESQRLMKKSNPSLVGFANGLLRNVSKNRKSIIEEFEGTLKDTPEDLAVKYSHPAWLMARWIRDFGLENTKRMAELNNTPPPVFIRLNPLKTDLNRLMAALAGEGVKVQPAPLNPQALLVESADISLLAGTRGFAGGLFTIQSLSSMLIAPLMDLKPGLRVLDLCAAPGSKTTHIAELMQGTGEVVARDISRGKLARIQENVDRLKLDNVRIQLGDATVQDPGSFDAFDRILLDAPCSGLGIIRRKGDIKWNRETGDIPALRKIQRNMINNAAKYVKIGGVILYSTCTLEVMENQGVIEEFLATHENFVMDSISEIDDAFIREGMLVVTPHEHGMDGFFACRLKRIG